MQGIMRAVSTSDITMFFYVNQSLHCRVLDRVMPYFTFFGGATFTLMTTFLLILLGKGYLRMVAVYGFMALAISFIIGYMLKKFFRRIRPYKVLPDARSGSQQLIDYSFPSGHTAAGFSLAVNYANAYPTIGLLIIFLAVMVGLSRIYLGQHYPTDVFAGAALGTLTAVFVPIIFI